MVKALLMVCGVAASTLSCAARQRRDPDQSHVRYQLGVEYYHGRRVEAAVEELDKALKADPENADAYNMLGIVALNQGHDYLHQAETQACLKGRDADLVRNDALQKFKVAEGHFRSAVRYRPDFPAAWNNLSVASLQLREWDQAIAAAREALKDATYAEPEFARANLGWAYFQKKDLQRAWRELHEAASRAPTFCVGRYRLAKVYVERGDFEQASEQVSAVTEDKRCPIQEAFLLEGLVRKRRGEGGKAAAAFQRCADLAPRSCIAEECRRYVGLIQ